MRVNFIGIGGQRCGKTTIYNWMEQHPQIGTSSEMELHFFNHRYDFGYNWYERNFSRQNETLITGEMSSSYIYDLSVPKRVFKYSPDMKIILSVRNPVSRLISAYRHDLQIGNIITETKYSILKGIDNKIASCKSCRDVDRIPIIPSISIILKPCFSNSNFIPYDVQRP